MALLIVGSCIPAPATAAFEWSHRSARAWLVGGDSTRWPVAPAGRVSITRSRPWSWPELEAVSLCATLARARLSLSAALGQLRIREHRESRLTAVLGLGGAGHRLSVGWSGLDFEVGGEGLAGHEISAAFSSARGRWSGRVIGLGAWRSRSAVALGLESELVFGLHVRAPPAELDLEWRESEVAGWGRLGAAIGVGSFLGVMAAVATTEPRLRMGASVRAGGLALDAAWLFHEELPTTPVLSLRWDAARDRGP
jgi:hypothetical protein